MSNKHPSSFISPPQAPGSQSDLGKFKNKTKVPRGFFIGFVVVGSMVFYLACVRPGIASYKAASWKVEKCTVISSYARNPGEKKIPGNEFSITYSYNAGGRQYTASRIDFNSQPAKHGFPSRQMFAIAFLPGKTFQCYYNPENPQESVIYRDYPPLLVSLVSFLFVAVGFGGLIGTLPFVETTSKSKN